MNCYNCGADNHTGARFCGKCGARLITEAVNTEIVNNMSSAVVLEKPEDGFFFKGVGFFKKLLIYAFGVLATFAVAMYVFAGTAPEYFSNMISYLSRFFY